MLPLHWRTEQTVPPCHRLHGGIGWLTPAERFDGTPCTDRGFENVPALEHLQGWLEALRKAA